MACLTAYTAILSATLYVISQSEFVRKYLLYPILFVLMFSAINFFIAIKGESVIDDYINCNIKIIDKLGMQEYAGLKVKKGLWRFIRNRYLFPLFYLVITIGVFYFLIRVLC